MPWKKSEPMDQRREFALKALRTLNFRAFCQDMGSAPRWDTNGEKGRCGKAWKGWALLVHLDPPSAGFPRTDFSAKNTKKPRTKTVTT
jgi:hypothetical protein